MIHLLTALPTSKMAFRQFCIFLSFLTILLQDANAFTTTSSTTATRTSSAGNETDRFALLAFKSKIFDGPQGALRSWNNSLHFCKWEGVRCGRWHQRVTALYLYSMGLVGPLSPYIGNLSFLREILLYNNTLQGDIPQEIGRLSRLRVLALYENSLSGEIPPSLLHCSNLTFLSLFSNKLTGKIPNELVSLSKLQYFSIHINYLSGAIPSSLGNLSSLLQISAGQNLLEGRIPDALGKLKNLTFLSFGGNKLSGTIPPSLYNLSLLKVFSFGDSELYGSLPRDFFLTLPRLQQLVFKGTQFTGPIPISLSNASDIEIFDLSRNNFTGKLLNNFGGLQRLRLLALAENNLGEGEADEMNFLHSLTNCSNLEGVDLNSNQFQGTLPNFVSNLSTNLQYLALDGNQLSGVIPSGIHFLVNLSHLSLGSNQFTGEIPTEMGNSKNLQRLILSDNRLSGQIPFSLGNLSSLIILQLEINRLQGAVQSSLGNLQQLLSLDLSQNNLSGTIPEQLFAIPTLAISLNLAKNRLIGSLSRSVGNLTNLVELDLSGNMLSGEIPSDLGRCVGLENLYLEGNFFHGPIPPSLSSLRGIQKLDISHNNFSGQIPKYFDKFPLKSLNLSFNDFEGEVPTNGVFGNASAISITGNNRLCGGINELKLPKCTFKVSKKGKMSRALLLMIPIASALVGTIVLSLLCCWFMKGRKQLSLGSLLDQSSFKVVSYQDLLKASDGFSSANLIGVGSFGSVYKGNLDETVVAVKVLDLQRRGASKSFTAECEALRNIRHRNFVKVLTSCSSVDFQGNEFKALIYEFMTNGNLDSWLHPTSVTEQDEHQNLGLLQRINIAFDVACALDYIHHHCQNPIVHCDLKPSNILLDSDMTAHVGDFGLARFLPELTNVTEASSFGVRGTIGYVAPEYGIGNEPSTYGDVHSYGVLLLEMVTGKRPTDGMFVEGLNLHNFVEMALPDRVMEVVDPRLISAIEDASSKIPSDSGNGCRPNECLRTLAKIGVACSVEAPLERMGISMVVSELHSLRDALLQNEVRKETNC